MKSADVRKKYIEFFKARGHVEIPSAPIVPENDPTTLFTGSGMQPMVPYLLGQTHPLGTRLVDSQKCFRAQDIEEIGDNRHDTFFEMLGNWSLGDYFKKEQLTWFWEFLTHELKLPAEKLYVSVFAGDQEIPKDEEAARIWQALGVPAERIFYYDEKKNWWSRAGIKANMPVGEPGGPDSEIFFDFGTPHDLKYGETCNPNCDCGRFMEIGNNVFMTYKKTAQGFIPLEKKNIDFGGGLERLVAATENTSDVFATDLFMPIIHKLEAITHQQYSDGKNKPPMRVIADHVKAATFLVADGIFPSNKTQGYVVRRLLRRAAIKLRMLQGNPTTEQQFTPIIESVIQIYADTGYFDHHTVQDIDAIIGPELLKFSKTLDKGLREVQKIEHIDGKLAFDLYQTYGFPLEITEELFLEKGQKIDHEQFEREFNKHKDISRTAAAGMFKGGLADHSEQTTKLHTAHHLLLAALQKIVDPTIKQRGSNITAERLRMDFNYAQKLTPEEIVKVEEQVNQKITEDLPVTRVEMDRVEAEKIGAQMEFGHKYPDRVSVYIVGSQDNYFSAEFCGGPHVEHTGVLGKFKILKEESAGSGIRRIYGVLQ